MLEPNVHAEEKHRWEKIEVYTSSIPTMLGSDTRTLNNKPPTNSGLIKKQNKSLQVIPEKDQKANGRPTSQKPSETGILRDSSVSTGAGVHSLRPLQ